jgi:hypothetical protein
VNAFTWNVATDNITSYGENAIGTTSPLRDVIRVEIHPFYFPNTPYTITDNSQVSIGIEEFAVQSYRATAGNRRFHFMLNATAGATGAPYMLQDIGQSTAVFDFCKPIFEVNTITITFGNPFLLLSLQPDSGIGTISAAGTQTLITFTNEPFLALGDVIYITGFNTTAPADDIVQIEQINDQFGWAVTGLPTTTSIKIDVDLSTVVGAIVGNPFFIYFDSKRFFIRLELTYRQYIEPRH